MVTYSDKYILIDRVPVLEPDLLTWARWFEDDSHRRVDEDRLPDGVRVSTVFLGLDHNYVDGAPPLLFETMIFGGPHHDYCERYATWADAAVGHQQAVAIAEGK